MLEPLISLSARIGQDRDLVQAGGGNTSLKDDGLLWIKASGKWLVHAESDDMFVPVPMEHVYQKLERGDERFGEYSTRSGTMLRPSVETSMHAVLPQRVVVHVHSVRAISWAVQINGHSAVAPRLKGLRWSWIPYIHPGVPLALRIQAELATKPEVLLLGNHGLVVAADTVVAAQELLSDVERRLETELPPTSEPKWEDLDRLAAGTRWRPAAETVLHSLGTNPYACRLAGAGTLYPDHCVYLGPAAAVVHPDESIAEAIGRYEDRNAYEPAFVLVEGKGLLISDRLSRAGLELLACLQGVTARIPTTSPVGYLEDQAVARLMNWDAEKYRISMARMQN